MKPKLTRFNMITELMNHIQYLNKKLETQTEFNRKTWYMAKIKFAKSLIENIEKYYD